METQTFHCGVDLAGTPSQVIYVPPQPGDESNSDSSDGSLSAGAIAGIVIGVAVCLVGVLYFGLGKKSSVKKEPKVALEDGTDKSSELA
jgi:H+/gluconate symporter-like permease